MALIVLRRPSENDLEELTRFFKTVLDDTFAREGLESLTDEIESEMKSKEEKLESDLNSGGKSRYFLLAVDQQLNKIVGTIELGPANQLIEECTEGKLKGMTEIGTVFVLPGYQGRGIGSLLINAALLLLHAWSIDEFCLDSGYKTAQKVWMRKFGEPEYWLKDYWGMGADHMIWRKNTKAQAIAFHL